MRQQQPPKEVKNPGNFSLVDGKIKINTVQGQSSVLVEDISSISWKRKSARKPNYFIMLLAIPFFFSSKIISPNSEYYGYAAIVSIMMVIFIPLIALTASKEEWEDVIVETRGGMLMTYSVELGEGSKEVEKIEDKKRDFLKMKG